MRWDIQSDVIQRGEMYKIRWVSTFGKLLWVIFWIWWVGVFYALEIIEIWYKFIILCLFLAYMKKGAFKWLSISKGKSALTAVIYKSHWRCNIPCLLFIGLLIDLIEINWSCYLNISVIGSWYLVFRSHTLCLVKKQLEALAAEMAALSARTPDTRLLLSLFKIKSFLVQMSLSWNICFLSLCFCVYIFA